MTLVMVELASFSYAVSHDLRAPLRHIDGFSQALLQDHGALLPEEGQQHLALVRRSAQILGQSIDGLLGLARVTRGDLRRAPVDLGEIVRGLDAELRAAHPAREVDLVLDAGLTAEADVRLIRVALGNLLDNAWKFTSKRPRARIQVGRTVKDGQSVFFVRDDGAGFDMNFAAKLFGAFQRLHRTTEFEGSGMGLATVRRIIARHGGQIWAVGEVDRGAVFSFTLPPGKGQS